MAYLKHAQKLKNKIKKHIYSVQFLKYIEGHIYSSALKFNTSVKSSILPALLIWIEEKQDVYHAKKNKNK